MRHISSVLYIQQYSIANNSKEQGTINTKIFSNNQLNTSQSGLQKGVLGK